MRYSICHHISRVVHQNPLHLLVLIPIRFTVLRCTGHTVYGTAYVPSPVQYTVVMSSSRVHIDSVSVLVCMQHAAGLYPPPSTPPPLPPPPFIAFTANSATTNTCELSGQSRKHSTYSCRCGRVLADLMPFRAVTDVQRLVLDLPRRRR